MSTEVLWQSVDEADKAAVCPHMHATEEASQQLHIGYVARQIQADPVIINEYLAQDLSDEARTDLRFAVKAAIAGQLDEVGAVEAIAQLTEPYPTSFHELSETLDESYPEAMRPRLRTIMTNPRWQPVVDTVSEWSAITLTTPKTSPELRATELADTLLAKSFGDGIGTFVKKTKAVNNILVGRCAIQEPEVIATLLATSRIVRRIASGATEEGGEVAEGDPYNLLQAGDSKCPGRLQMRIDPKVRNGRSLKNKRSCAVLQNGQFFNKLFARAINDSLQCGLLGKLSN